MTTVLQMDSVFYNIPKRLFFLLPRLPLSGILLFLRLDFAFDVVVLFLILHSDVYKRQLLNSNHYQYHYYFNAKELL